MNNNKKVINELKDKINSIYKMHKKELVVLAGAGINFNLTKDGIGWDDFIVNSIASEFETGSKYTRDITAKDIYFNNDYKLALMPNLGSKKMSFELSEDTIWFTNSVRNISKKTNTTFITTNYDDVLERVTGYKGIDSFEDSEISELTVSHIHGKYKKGEDSKLLLTMADYIDKSDDVSLVFKDYIENQIMIKAEVIILIIGFSMNEMHISKVIKKMAGKHNGKITVYFVTRFNANKMVDNYIRKRLMHAFNVKVINIKKSDSYIKDFKTFWKDIGADNINKSISLPALVKGPKSLEELDINGFKYNSDLSLQKNMEKLDFLNIVGKLEVARMWTRQGFISGDYHNKLIEESAIPDIWSMFDPFKPYISVSNMSTIIKQGPKGYTQDTDFLKIMEYIFKTNVKMAHEAIKDPRWQNWLYSKIMESKSTRYFDLDWKSLATKIDSKFIDEINSFEYIDYYPYTDTSFYELFSNNIPTIRNISELLEVLEGGRGIGSIKEYLRLSSLINSNYSKTLPKEEMTKLFAILKNEKDSDKRHHFFQGLCLFFFKSNNRKYFVNMVRSEEDFPYDYWPSSLDYIGVEGTNIAVFDILDKDLIKGEIAKKRSLDSILKDIEEKNRQGTFPVRKLADEFLNTSSESIDNDKKELYGKFYKITGNTLYMLKEIRILTYQSKNWDDYSETVNILPNKFVSIKPPSNIDHDIKKAAEDKDFNEFLRLLQIYANHFFLSVYDIRDRNSNFGYIHKLGLLSLPEYTKKINKVLSTVKLSLDKEFLISKFMQEKEIPILSAIVDLICSIDKSYKFSSDCVEHLKSVLKESQHIRNIGYITKKVFGKKRLEMLGEIHESKEYDSIKHKQISYFMILEWIAKKSKTVPSFKISEILYFRSLFGSIKEVSADLSELIIASKPENINQYERFVSFSYVDISDFNIKAKVSIFNVVKKIIEACKFDEEYEGPINSYNIKNIEKILNELLPIESIKKEVEKYIEILKMTKAFKALIS